MARRLGCALDAGADRGVVLLQGVEKDAPYADRSLGSFQTRVLGAKDTAASYWNWKEEGGAMKRFINKVRRFRIWTLFLKELRQIKADKKLVVSLILPPTLQLVIFGFALNPEVTNLRLGVVDESRTAASREVISAFVESRSFH